MFSTDTAQKIAVPTLVLDERGGASQVLSNLVPTGEGLAASIRSSFESRGDHDASKSRHGPSTRHEAIRTASGRVVTVNDPGYYSLWADRCRRTYEDERGVLFGTNSDGRSHMVTLCDILREIVLKASAEGEIASAKGKGASKAVGADTAQQERGSDLPAGPASRASAERDPEREARSVLQDIKAQLTEGAGESKFPKAISNSGKGGLRGFATKTLLKLSGGSQDESVSPDYLHLPETSQAIQKLVEVGRKPFEDMLASRGLKDISTLSDVHVLGQETYAWVEMERAIMGQLLPLTWISYDIEGTKAAGDELRSRATKCRRCLEALEAREAKLNAPAEQKQKRGLFKRYSAP